jgi:hypothetical protein
MEQILVFLITTKQVDNEMQTVREVCPIYNTGGDRAVRRRIVLLQQLF